MISKEFFSFLLFIYFILFIENNTMCQKWVQWIVYAYTRVKRICARVFTIKVVCSWCGLIDIVLSLYSQAAQGCLRQHSCHAQVRSSLSCAHPLTRSPHTPASMSLAVNPSQHLPERQSLSAPPASPQKCLIKRGKGRSLKLLCIVIPVSPF